MKIHQFFAGALLAGLALPGGGLCQPLYAQAAATAPTAYTDAFAAAAYLPAETESFGVLNTAALTELALKAGLPQECIPAELAAIDSIAIGIPNDWAKGIDAYAAIADIALRIVASNDILADWSTTANAACAQTLRNTEPDYTAQTAAVQTWANSPTAQAYAILCTKPGQEAAQAQICGFLDSFCEHMQLTDKAVTAYQQNGWKGVHLRFDTAATNLMPMELEQALENLNLYLVYRVEGRAIIAAICHDPTRLSICTKAENSVLNTPKVEFLPVQEPHRILFAGNISPAILNSLNNIPQRLLGAIGSPLIQGFNNIAAQHPHLATEMQSGAKSVQQIVAELAKLTPEVNSPLTFAAWHDGNLHFELEADACGNTFTTATVNTAGKDTAALYLYGSTLHSPNLPSLDTLVYCGFDVCNTIAHTLPLQEQSDVLMKLNTAKMVYAMLPGMLAPVGNMIDSLGNGWCITTARVHSEAEGTTDSVFGVNINVANRTKLAEGWQGTLNNITALTGMVAPDKAVLIESMSDGIYSKELNPGGEKRYTLYSHPLCRAAALVLSDTELMLSNDFRYACSLPLHPHPENICGIKMGFDLKQLIIQYPHHRNRRTTSQADVQALIRNAICEHVLSVISGGTLYLTTENGKMKLSIHLDTPGLR